MLKVLWLTNHIMPEHARVLGLSSSPRGGWMPALAESLVESNNVTLRVATNLSGSTSRYDDISGIRYYAIPSNGDLHQGHIPVKLIQQYKRIVDDFCPDVIHIHGTENFQGLLTGRGHLDCPTVISIQGILDACQRHYWGDIPLFNMLTTRTLRDYVRMDGLFEQRFRMKTRAKMEQEIFTSNTAFIGRTKWDRAYTRRLNSIARYYHCDEMIRRPFFESRWDIRRIKRHSIFASSASYPLKGFHVLIKAVAILRKEFPDITLQSPLANLYPELSGIRRFWKNFRVGGYARYLNDLIVENGLQKNVIPLPSLVAQGMVHELRKAHVFILPSFIENSPNSLAEAMLVGTPSVASYVGGVPSIVSNEESALLFPPGDEIILAEQIRRIFLDDTLAEGVSRRAREISRIRHSRDKILGDMLDIYRTESVFV